MSHEMTASDSITQQVEFTKQEFVRQFAVLSSSASTNAMRESANQYILKFQKTDAVWQVARELIIDPPTVELQCLGAQILCKRLKSNYATLTAQQRLELRSFFFEVLSLYCTRGGTACVSKIAKAQIVLSIAILGFTGIHNGWENFIQDICEFMKTDCDQQQFMICGLEILENVGSAESVEKVVPDLKVFLRIRSLFQSHMSQLSAIFNELLVHPNRQVGLKVLECIESWTGSQFKYQVFLDERLTSNLLLLMGSQDDELFSKVARIMLEGIQHSNNAEILQTANVAASLSLMRAEEIASLKALITTLVTRAAIFVTSKLSQASRLFAELVTELASKFEILILEHSEQSTQLLGLVLICTQHSNLYIAQSSFVFWNSFYRILKAYVPDIKESSSDWLIKPYISAFQAVLQSCKLRNLSNKKNLKKRQPIQLQKKYQLLSTGSGFDLTFSSSSKAIDRALTDVDNQMQISQMPFDDNFIETVELVDVDPDDYAHQCSDDGGYDDDDDDEDDDDDDDGDGDDDEAGENNTNSSNKKNDLNLQIDEFNSEIPKVRLKEFRVMSKDIFNTVYNVVSQFRGPAGVFELMSMLSSLLDKSKYINNKGTATTTTNNNNNVLSPEAAALYCSDVEVCLLVAQYISSFMLPGDSYGESSFSYFFNFIVNSADFPEHEKTVNMAMQLFYNAQSEVMKSIQLFDSVMKFILKYILHETLGFMASQTFSGIIKEAGPNDAIETFKYVATFFVQNIDHIRQEQVLDELIKGVFGFALNLKSPAHQIEAIQSLLHLIQQIINATQQQAASANSAPSPHSLARPISIIQSLLSGFSAESISITIKTSVADFIQLNFQFLTHSFDILTLQSNAQNTISQFIAIFRHVNNIFTACSTSSSNTLNQTPDDAQNGTCTYLFFQQYIAFLNTSILIQQRNPVLFCETMTVFKTILNITKTSSYHDPFLQWLQQNFNEYNRFYLDFMQTPPSNHTNSASAKISQQRKDPDLIMHFYEIQVQVIKYFSSFYLQHECFLNIIEFSFEIVQSISQYEMTRSILNFFYEFIKYCAHEKSTQDIILRVIDTTIDILPNVNSNLLHNIALILVKLVEVYRDRTEHLHAFILTCFQSKEKYTQFTPTQQKTLVDCIIQFSINCKNVNPLKLLLIDIYQVLKDLLPSQEMFMNYEIKLKAITDPGNSTPTNVQQQNQQQPKSTQQAFLDQLSSTLQARNKVVKNISDLDDLFN